MAKNESLFSSRLQSMLSSFFFVQPIESRLTGLGIPDLYMHPDLRKFPAIDAAFSAWLELKDAGDVLDTMTAPIAFEAGQLNKLYEMYHSGVLSGVCIFHKMQGVFVIPTTAIDRMTQTIKKDCIDAVLLIPISLFTVKVAEKQAEMAKIVLTYLSVQRKAQLSVLLRHL